MEPPGRTLGVAFSDGDRVSRVAGAVVRRDSALDGLRFGSCSVGGTDATAAVADLVADLDREDVRHVCLAGIAPAWFNLLDLDRLHAAVERPVYSVSYEASPGLEPALREAFDGDPLEERLATYQSLPRRHRVTEVAGETVERAAEESSDAGDGTPLFVRAVGLDVAEAAAATSALVRDGFRRPEPLRIASIAANAHREALPDAD